MSDGDAPNCGLVESDADNGSFSVAGRSMSGARVVLSFLATSAPDELATKTRRVSVIL